MRPLSSHWCCTKTRHSPSLLSRILSTILAPQRGYSSSYGPLSNKTPVTAQPREQKHSRGETNFTLANHLRRLHHPARCIISYVIFHVFETPSNIPWRLVIWDCATQQDAIFICRPFTGVTAFSLSAVGSFSLRAYRYSHHHAVSAWTLPCSSAEPPC